MTIYLSGPISGLPNGNREAFAHAAARLRADGALVVNPHELHADEDLSWAEYMRADLMALLTCQRIMMLPGWEKSRGALLEKQVAEAVGMPVTFAAEHMVEPV